MWLGIPVFTDTMKLSNVRSGNAILCFCPLAKFKCDGIIIFSYNKINSLQLSKKPSICLCSVMPRGRCYGYFTGPHCHDCRPRPTLLALAIIISCTLTCKLATQHTPVRSIITKHFSNTSSYWARLRVFFYYLIKYVPLWKSIVNSLY